MSYLFDGVDDRLANGTDGGVDLELATYSVMFWYSWAATGGHAQPRVLGRNLNYFDYNQHMGAMLSLATGSGAGDLFRQARGVDVRERTSQNVVHFARDDTWNNYIATYDSVGSPQTDVYVGGALANVSVENNTDAIRYMTGTEFALGGLVRGNDTRSYAGKLAHVAIWNRLLTAQEITDLSGGGVPSVVASSGLIRYWPLTVDAVTQVDEAGSGHDLTVYGSAYSTDDPPVSAPGTITQTLPTLSQALSGTFALAQGSYFFDGVDDIMSDGTNGGTDLNIDTYSMMAWVKVDDSVLLADGHVMGRATGTHSNNHMVSRIVGGGTPEDMHRQGSQGGGVAGGQLEVATKPHTLDGTAWDVMVATFSTGRADRWEGYMNGVQYGTYIADDGTALDYNTGHQYTLGAIYDNTARNFAGYMAHVAVWNRLLTAQEITDLSNGGNPEVVAPSGLIRYWPLTTDSVTQVDQAGSGHDLTVTGATYSTDGPPIDPPVVDAVVQTLPSLTQAASGTVRAANAFFFDFSDYTVDADITTQGWTSIWHAGMNAIVRTSAEAQYGGKVVEVSSSSEVRQAITYDAAPSPSNLFDLIVRVKTTTIGSQFNFRMGLKLSGDSTSEDGAMAPLFYNSAASPPDRFITPVTYANAAGTTHTATDQNIQFGNVWVYLRSKTFPDGSLKACYSTDLAQVYDVNNPAGDPPMGWTTTVDASAVSAGTFGFQGQQVDYVAEVDWFGVGLDGSAPLVAPLATTTISVLFVVASTTLNANDQAMVDFLRTSLRCAVTTQDHLAQPNFTGHDIVIISESCVSSNLAVYQVDYRDTALPMICFENGLWDELHFGTGSGTVLLGTQLTIADPASQAAAGYSGTQTYLTTGVDQKYLTVPAAGVHTVAHVPTFADRPLVFTVEAGATLTTGTAASRRVGIGWLEDTFPVLTAVGYDIIAEAFRWALGQSVAKDRTALLVVGVAALNVSEQYVRSRLLSLGYTTTIVLDAAVTTTQANGFDIVVMSKTVLSTNVGTVLKGTTASVIFWEDNQQALTMLATVDDTNVTGTAWHNPETRVTIDPAAPAELAAELSGTIDFYRVSGELTYAPKTDGGLQTLGAGAQRVAEYGAGTQDWWSLYVFDQGATLADATQALGKRAYFGLYDDTYRLLTLDGVALFDAMVTWATPVPVLSLVSKTASTVHLSWTDRGAPQHEIQRREHAVVWAVDAAPPDVSTGNGAAYSPDSNWLAVGGTNGLFVFDAETMALVTDFAAIGGQGVAWSSDGNRLAIAHTSTPYLLVVDSSDPDPANWTVVAGTPTLHNQALAVTFSPDGAYLATAGLGQEPFPRTNPFYRVYATSDWSEVTGLPTITEDNRAYDIAWSPNGNWLAVSHAASPRLFVLDVSDPTPANWAQITTPSMPGTGWGCDFSPNSNWLAVSVSAFSGSRIRVISTSTWAVVAGPSSSVTGRRSKFDPSGAYYGHTVLNTIVAGEGEVEVFDTSDPDPANWVLVDKVPLPSNPNAVGFRGGGVPDIAAARFTPNGLTTAKYSAVTDWVLVDTVPETSFQDSGLTPLTTYDYRVRDKT